MNVERLVLPFLLVFIGSMNVKSIWYSPTLISVKDEVTVSCYVMRKMLLHCGDHADIVDEYATL